MLFCSSHARRGGGGGGGEGKQKNAQWTHSIAVSPHPIVGAEMSSRQQRLLFEFGNLLHASRIILPTRDDE